MTNPGPQGPVPTVCRILCSNVLGLAGNLSDLTVDSSQYDIQLCTETLVSDRRHMSELLIPGIGRPELLCRSKMPRAQEIATYVIDGYGAFRQRKYECGCCEMLVFRVCVVIQNLHVFSLYRNPDLDDPIFDCLLTSKAAVQTEDVRDSFLFVGDFTIANNTGCNQLVPGPTHSRGGIFDLLMTDVPDLVRVAVLAPIGNSDHSSLSAVISMAQAVPNLFLIRNVLRKHKVN